MKEHVAAKTGTEKLTMRVTMRTLAAVKGLDVHINKVNVTMYNYIIVLLIIIIIIVATVQAGAWLL